MHLKGRLYLIAGKVPRCNIVGDVGTDHAYIPVYLIAKDVCEKVIATDIGAGPVRAAQKNIRAYNMEECIETRLGDGLEPIGEGECDAIIIAGMGGLLIKDILERQVEKAKKAPCLILQPMNAFDVLRQWLYENGFDIYDEELTDEGDKIYIVMCVRWTGTSRQTDEVFYHIGEKLIENKDPLLTEFLQKRIKQAEKVLNGLEKTNDDMTDTIEKYKVLKNKLLELNGRIKRGDTSQKG